MNPMKCVRLSILHGARETQKYSIIEIYQNIQTEFTVMSYLELEHVAFILIKHFGI